MKFRLAVTVVLACGVNLLSPQPLQAIEPIKDMDGALLENQILEFLGIGGSFGRWVEGRIPIAYNPTGRPDSITDSELEQRLLTSFSVLESIAGIKFDYRGLTTADIEDSNDNLVVVAWEALDTSIAGLAGPRFGKIDSAESDRLGYFPYKDGTVRLSNVISNPAAQRTITHELIHLLGFGHSENPISIMNTSAAFFNTPQQDDINALQALYGPPDVFTAPKEVIEFPSGSTGSSATLDASNSGFVIRADGADLNDINDISSIDSSQNDGDALFYRIAFNNANVGDTFAALVSDPNQNLLRSNESVVEFQDGTVFVFVGFVKQFRSSPGDWIAQLGLNGASFGQAVLPVTSPPISFNATPTASIASALISGTSHNVTVAAADAEGDSITLTWHVPEVGEIENGDNNIFVNVDSLTPEQVFVEINDSGDKTVNVPGGAGSGFGNIVSHYIVTPIEQGVPTFYVSSGLLHIPALDIGADTIFLNFQLTKLEGIRLKLLSFGSVSGTTPQATLDTTGAFLEIPRLLVVDNSAVTSFSQLRFLIEFDAQPIKISL